MEKSAEGGATLARLSPCHLGFELGIEWPSRVELLDPIDR